MCNQIISLLQKFILIRFDQEDAKVVDLTDKMWLVKELERMRMFILDDLITVKVDNCSFFFRPFIRLLLLLVFRKIFKYLYHPLLRELSEIVCISKITTLRIILFTLRFLQSRTNDFYGLFYTMKIQGPIMYDYPNFQNRASR